LDLQNKAVLALNKLERYRLAQLLLFKKRWRSNIDTGQSSCAGKKVFQMLISRSNSYCWCCKS